MTSQTYDDSNIFAKILRGDLPSEKLIETDEILAFMDVMPMSPGHCLVVSKRPSRNLLDADPQALPAVIETVQRLAIAVKKAFDADGVRVFQFNEEAAGQKVFHLHFHVAPAHAGQEPKRHSDKMEDPDVLKANADKIRTALDG